MWKHLFHKKMNLGWFKSTSIYSRSVLASVFRLWQLKSETTVLIPSLTNQPLIENPLKHGILKLSEGRTIHIRIINFDTHLEITVADNALKWMKSNWQNYYSLKNFYPSDCNTIKPRSTYDKQASRRNGGFICGSSKKTSTSLDALPLDEF